MRSLLLWLSFLAFSLPSRSEELLPKVQRELRARKFYFGQIDGRASDETVGAIRKFQEAKGIDRTGNLDRDTIRALGLMTAEADGTLDDHLLGECGNFVLHYLETRESNDWTKTAPFYAEVVDYYFERDVALAVLRRKVEEEDRRWPQRKITLLNRIATFLPDHRDLVQVTARVRTQSIGPSGAVTALTEDVIFRLRKANAGWQITAVKLLE